VQAALQEWRATDPPVALDVGVFDEAQREVVYLIRTGPYPRFVKSTLYADMLEFLDANGMCVAVALSTSTETSSYT
jgi:hypothetical protein